MLNQKKISVNNSRQCSSLPAALFKTPQAHYVFDVNRTNFLEVTETVFNVISSVKNKPKTLDELENELQKYSREDLREALEEFEAIQNEGYLVPHDFKRFNPYAFSQIKETLEGKLTNLYLNITSQCNLSCSYCVYGGDYANVNHLRHEEMSWDVARKAIDFFLPRSVREGTLRVDFFGGEPLLSFPLIQRVIDTLREELRAQNRDQALAITLNSNGTIFNEKIINFLIDNEVYLQVSIDGEKEIHDSKRKFRGTSKGSFDNIIKNLQVLYDRNPDYFLKRVSLKAVITTDAIETVDTDFFSIPLVSELSKRRQFVMINQSPHFDLNEDEDFFNRLHKLGESLLQKKNASSIDDLLDGLNYKKKHMFYLTFFEFFSIQVVNSIYYAPDEPVPYGKDCLIGLEGCVNVDGSISICYKSNSFIIGNVIENKWDYDKIKEFHHTRYSSHLESRCQHCFVRNFCNMCYETISGKEGRMQATIDNYCQFNRRYFRVIFEYMLQVMENNPDLWDVLEELAEKEQQAIAKKREAETA